MSDFFQNVNQAMNQLTDEELIQRAVSQRRHRQQADRPNLVLPIRVLLFLFINAAGALAALFVASIFPPFTLIIAGIVIAISLVVSVIIIRMIHVTAQWERAVVLRLGKFHSIRGPGLIIIFPVVDYLRIVDTRVLTQEIPRQLVITRDNVPVAINGVLYFKVTDVKDAIVNIQDYEYGILQYSMSALRDVIGRLDLDSLLSERDQIQTEIEEIIEKTAKSWGLTVDALRLKDIDMPEDLKRMMSRQASAEREKRATITKAEGDKLAALNLSEAARTMLTSPGAMQLRTLQTLDGLGGSPSNTVILALPTDIFTMFSKISDSLAGKDKDTTTIPEPDLFDLSSAIVTDTAEDKS